MSHLLPPLAAKKIADLETTRDEQGKELARVKLDYQDLKAKLEFELSSYEESDANLRERVKDLEATIQRVKNEVERLGFDSTWDFSTGFVLGKIKEALEQGDE